MQILEGRKVEDCFDGSSVYRYRFDEGWTSSTIQMLAPLGRLDYYPDFPRPLFRLVTPEGIQIKGVEGDPACRVIYPRQLGDALKVEFERRFPG